MNRYFVKFNALIAVLKDTVSMQFANLLARYISQRYIFIIQVNLENNEDGH